MTSSQESRYWSRKRKRASLTDEEKEKIRKTAKTHYDNVMDDETKHQLKRDYFNNYMRDIKKIRRVRGLCAYCGGERKIKKFKQCDKCRDYQRKYSQK